MTTKCNNSVATCGDLILVRIIYIVICNFCCLKICKHSIDFCTLSICKLAFTSCTLSPRSFYEILREQDRFLPIANVSRIMNKALPTNAKISKDAKETVLSVVSEFISFIAGEASDKCQREKRKTINGDDLLWAMTTLGFEDYVEPLKVYLQRFRDMEGEKTALAGRQGGEKDSGGGPTASGSGNGGVVNIEDNGRGFHENNGGGIMYGTMMGHHHQGGHLYGSDGFHLKEELTRTLIMINFGTSESIRSLLDT